MLACGTAISQLTMRYGRFIGHRRSDTPIGLQHLVDRFGTKVDCLHRKPLIRRMNELPEHERVG